MTTLFSKLTKHEQELKRLETSEGNVKRKDKTREGNISISLKASTSKDKI